MEVKEGGNKERKKSNFLENPEKQKEGWWSQILLKSQLGDRQINTLLHTLTHSRID